MAENVLSRLSIAITTDGAIKATTELEKLTGAAKQTEVQAGKTASAATLLAKEQVEAAKEAKKLQDATSKLIKDLELEAMSVGKTADEIKLLKLEQAGATKTQLDAAKAAIANKNAQKELGQQSNVVKGKFGAMKGATQNISYQLQDVAVQAQMGTSAFIILGQQGPQLASIFGPGGAVVGAIIAFGSMLGGLAYSMLVSSRGTEELQSAVRDLGKEYGELTIAQQLLIKAQNDLEIKRLTNENKQLGEQAAYNAVVLSGLARAYGQSADAGDELEASANANRVQMELNATTIEALTNENAGLSKSTADVIASLDLELQMMGKTERQKAILEAQLKKAAPEQIQEINRIYDSIEAKEQEIELKQQQLATDKEISAQKLKDEEANKQAAASAAKRLADAQGANDTVIESLRRRSEAQQAILEQDRARAVAMAQQTGADVAQINETYTQAALTIEAGTNAKILEINRNLLASKEADEISYLAQWQERTAESMMNLDLLSATMADSLSNNLGGAFTSFLTGASSAKEAFKDFATGMAQMLVSTLANMAAQQVAYFLVEKALGKTAQASAGSAMTFNALAAQQLAGINAFAATAAIPIVGPALAPAAMTAAIAATAPFVAATAALSTAAVGARALGGQVRGGESYLVGERGPELLTMGTSGRIATNENLKNAVGGGGGVSIVNNVDARGSGPDVESKIRTAMEQTSAQTIATIQDLMRRRRFV
jgi:hypothetical protein